LRVSENFIQGVRRDTHTQIQPIETKKREKYKHICLFFFEKRRATVQKRDRVSKRKKRKKKRTEVYICLLKEKNSN